MQLAQYGEDDASHHGRHDLGVCEEEGLRRELLHSWVARGIQTSAYRPQKSSVSSNSEVATMSKVLNPCRNKVTVQQPQMTVAVVDGHCNESFASRESGVTIGKVVWWLADLPSKHKTVRGGEPLAGRREERSIGLIREEVGGQHNHKAQKRGAIISSRLGPEGVDSCLSRVAVSMGMAPIGAGNLTLAHRSEATSLVIDRPSEDSCGGRRDCQKACCSSHSLLTTSRMQDTTYLEVGTLARETTRFTNMSTALRGPGWPLVPLSRTRAFRSETRSGSRISLRDCKSTSGVRGLEVRRRRESSPSRQAASVMNAINLGAVGERGAAFETEFWQEPVGVEDGCRWATRREKEDREHVVVAREGNFLLSHALDASFPLTYDKIPLSEFSPELLGNFLLNLPYLSLLSAMRVCAQWNAIIQKDPAISVQMFKKPSMVYVEPASLTDPRETFYPASVRKGSEPSHPAINEMHPCYRVSCGIEEVVFYDSEERPVNSSIVNDFISVPMVTTIKLN
ncbi:hypothetical protein B0H19DRAFT_1229739 [Mycena capillaripes]|nr:hypothetical protein B0H19DRAFT_1229739 [Mycena capillaripes]